MDFIIFFIYSFFTKVPVVAFIILGIFFAAFFSIIISFRDKKLNNFSRYAPTILTTAGLFGTFIGLTNGLREIQTSTNGSIDANSIGGLIVHLKVVFVYALSGVFSSLIFMILNTFVLKVQNKVQNQIIDQNKHDAKTHNQTLLNLQQIQSDTLNDLVQLQKQQLNHQKLMQQDIAKLQFDNDNEQLTTLISQGVVRGLSPLLHEIKTEIGRAHV